MHSKAAIGNHPLHPAAVPIPIGAFTVTLVADIAMASGHGAWGNTARYALAIGIVGALVAAVLGLVDYLRMEMSERGKQLATTHLVLNLIGVVLMAASLWMRQSTPARWTAAAFAVSTIAFLLFLVSGWIGGDMVYQHKLAVVENADPEATAVGQREAA